MLTVIIEVLRRFSKSIGKPLEANQNLASPNQAKSVDANLQLQQRILQIPRKSATKQLMQPVSPRASGLIGFTEVGEDNWKPPPAKDGNWDPLIQSVDTVVREAEDGEVWGYLIWNEKNDEGRFYRSKASLPVIYKACPQRVCY